MSTEEKPLPDFAQIPTESPSTALPKRPVASTGLPRGRRAAAVSTPASAFAIIEEDETSRTLDFGMSEEDMLDDSDGEGSSSELHNSLRVLHGAPGVIEEDFSGLSTDYANEAPEEDSYKKAEVDFELPDLDASPVVATPSVESVAPKTRRELRNQSLPDFSKFDEVEKVEETSKSLDGLEEPKPKKMSSMLMLLIAAVVIVAAIVVAVVVFVVPGLSSPGIIMAPGELLFGGDSTHLLQ